MTVRVRPEEIFYIESVEDKTYLYCDKDILQSELRLYEYEVKLGAADFVRTSKSCILNLSKVKKFKSSFNRKMEVILENGEHLEINRTYVPEIKERLL